MKILFRGHSLFEWIELIFAFALVVVGIFYTFYAAKQWDVMKKALDKTDIAIGQTTKALQLSERQTKATEASADAAKGALDIAKLTLSSNEDSFKIEQRAYVIAAQQAFVVNHTPDTNAGVLVNLNFPNVGKTPAHDTRTYGCMAALASLGGVYNEPEQTMVDAMFARARQHPRAHGADLAPNNSDVFTVPLTDSECKPTNFLNARSLTPAERARLAQRAILILVVGGIIYHDEFGSTHETEVCSIFTAPGEAAGQCLANGSHNRMK